MRYSLDAGGKRLRPILTLAAAEAVAGTVGAAERAIELALAGGVRGRAHPHLLAHSRRSSGNGRRLAAAGSADEPRRVRRGDGDSGRRRPADRSVRAALGRAARPGARREKDSRDSGDRAPRPARAAWSAGRRSICSPSGSSTLRRVLAAGHARAQDGRADSRGRGGGRHHGRRRRRRDSRRSTNTAGTSAWPFRSSTTFSTSRATRKISARPPARTPGRASRPTLPPTASTRRAGSPPSATTMRSRRCDRRDSQSRGSPTSPPGSSREQTELQLDWQIETPA